MTDIAKDRVTAIKKRFKEMGIETGDPKWSSWVLDQLLDSAVSGTGGSLQAVYAALNDALRDYAVQLTHPVASLIRDVVVNGFTRHPSAYKAIDWRWANEELKNAGLPVSCYLFLHALPPEEAKAESIVRILRGLEGTDYQQEALDTLSDDLEKPEVQALLDSEVVGPAKPAAKQHI